MGIYALILELRMKTMKSNDFDKIVAYLKSLGVDVDNMTIPQILEEYKKSTY